MARAWISDQPTAFTSPQAKQSTAWRNLRRGFAEKADSGGGSNCGANYDTVLPAGWWPQQYCPSAILRRRGHKNPLADLLCFDSRHSSCSITAAYVLDFHPRPCCMRGLPLSRTLRARLPPPRPHPREIVPLGQGWRVSLPFTGPLKPHICFSTCAEYQYYQFFSLYRVHMGKISIGWVHVYKLAAPSV